MKKIITALLLAVVLFASFELVAQERKSLDEQRISELRNMVENTRLDLTLLLKYARRPPSDGNIKTLPAQFSWHDLEGEDWMSPVRDQESCGSCWTFGTIAALEAAINIYLTDSEFDYDLSEQHMVSCGAGSCDNGGLAEEVLGYLRNSGIPDEACFPYEAEELACDLTCEDWESRAVKISDWGLILNPTEQELKEELLNGPLPVTMKVTSGFYDYSGGVYVGSSEVCNLITNPPNHVVALVGWDDSDNTWIAKNSWNTDWGIEGYMKIQRGTDCFATVSADWLRVDPPTIPGVEGDVALCISPAILNIEVPEGTESDPVPVTLQNCGDFASNWSMDTTGTWKYWIYPTPFNGTLDVDQSVTVNLVIDAEQKEAGDNFDVQLTFIPALTGQNANIMLNISIIENEPIDGDDETPPADEDENLNDGDIDEDSPGENEVENNEIDNMENWECMEGWGDEDSIEYPDGDAAEDEINTDGDNYENTDGDADKNENTADGDSDGVSTEDGNEDDNGSPGGGDENDGLADQQGTSSSSVCGISGAPQGLAFVLLSLLVFTIRRRSVH